MWDVAVIAITVALAVVVQRLVVPQLRQPHVDDGEDAPDFTGLGGTSNLLLVLAFATLGGLAAWRTHTPVWPWLGYIALGAPLVVVDLRTTYLPNQLMHPLWATAGVGLAISAATDARAAIAGVVGALAGYAWFWGVWRMSSTFGFGDVRLAAVAGAVAGMSGMTGWLTSLVIATAIGAAAAIVARASGRTVFPYGPWLWLGPVVATWLPTGS